MKYFLLAVLLTTALFASPVPIDRQAKRFEMRKKQHVDIFDFSGSFLQLENIDIDARRKKRVDFLLTGEYPLLESVVYEGTFGVLNATLTGLFPKLKEIDFLCGDCAMNIDLSAEWQDSCVINIRGRKEPVSIALPKNVGVILQTHTALKGKVFPPEDVQKKGWWKLFNKTYRNPLAETSPVVLIVNVETTDGNIYFQ